MWLNYLKIALRQLWRHKTFSLINISGLAIGMACFLLIALFVREEWSYDRFHTRAERIFRISPPEYARTAPLLAPTLKKDLPEVQKAVRMMRFFGLFKSENQQFNEDRMFFAAPDLLDMLTFEFTQGNGDLNGPDKIILSESHARKYFGDEPAVGQTLTIMDTVHLSVTGVFRDLPEHTHLRIEGVIPFETLENLRMGRMDTWSNNIYYTYVLLQPGTDPVNFQKKLDAFVDRHIHALPNWEDYALQAQNIMDIHLHSNKKMELDANGNTATLAIFISVAVFVLLIAGINYVNLSTALAARRAKEIGIRKSVGVTIPQLIGQFLFESVTAAFLAAGLALFLVHLGLPLLNMLASKNISISVLFGSLPILALTGFSLVTGLLAGLYPAFVLSSYRPAEALKKEFMGAARQPRLRQGLIVLQFALSILLAVGTVVVFRQLSFLKSEPLGYDQEHILVVPFSWDSDVQTQFDLLKDEWEHLPGIQEVTASGDIPGRMATSMSYWAEGMPENESNGIQALYVDRDFLETYQMSLLAGSDFRSPPQPEADQEYILNETAVKSMGWTNETAIGKRFSVHRDGRVIGVVKDFHYNSLHQPIQPLFISERPDWCGYFSLRVSPGNTDQSLDGVQQVWKRVFSDRPFDFFFLDNDFNNQYLAEVRMGKIAAVFSSLAFLIALIGMLALTLFTVQQRVKEIGIRKILGASPAGIVFLLSRDFMKLVAIGLALAVPAAWYFSGQWLARFAYRIELNGWVFANLVLCAGGIALLVAGLAVGVQSARAAFANPVESLRNE